MPLIQTDHNYACPLRYWSSDALKEDPLEICLDCYFGDTDYYGADLGAVCHCPSDMTRSGFKDMKNVYLKSTDKPERKEFWKFVKENYKPQPATEPNSSN